MSSLLGRELQISYKNKIHYLYCGKTPRKLYGRICYYPCIIKIPEFSGTIIEIKG